MRIGEPARKHGVSDADILQAVRYPGGEPVLALWAVVDGSVAARYRRVAGPRLTGSGRMMVGLPWRPLWIDVPGRPLPGRSLSDRDAALTELLDRWPYIGGTREAEEVMATTACARAERIEFRTTPALRRLMAWPSPFGE